MGPAPKNTQSRPGAQNRKYSWTTERPPATDGIGDQTAYRNALLDWKCAHEEMAKDDDLQTYALNRTSS